MTAKAKKIFEQALALPDAERADVLEDSLQGANDDLIPEWTAEITRRITAVSRGESQVIPGDEVDARIRRALDCA